MIVQRVSVCFAQCEENNARETNEATCMLQCVQDESDGLDACGSECLDGYLECYSPCDRASLDTDVYTCRLNCRQAAEGCLDGCSAA